MIKCGSYTLHPIDTGTFKLDGGAMFGIVPKPLWEKRIPADAKNRITLAMRCLLIRGKGRCMLVDTGIGDTFSDKEESIFGIDHSTHTLVDSLEAVGVAPSDITDVIFTHLHFDHSGGAVTVHDGTVAPQFPEATHHVQAAHWEAARNPNPKEKNSFRNAILAPLAEEVSWTFHDGPGPMMPGIELMQVDGHTHAQQLVKISGPERTCVFVGDLLPTHHHVGDAWTMAYDIAPLQTIDEKARFLQEAQAQDWLLLFEHDPDVPAGRLRTTEHGVRVIPESPEL